MLSKLRELNRYRIKSAFNRLKAVPGPKNVDELITFIEAANYYRRYLTNLSTVIAPLQRLRGKGLAWKWSTEEQKSFNLLKDLLCSAKVLTIYNPSSPLTWTQMPPAQEWVLCYLILCPIGKTAQLSLSLEPCLQQSIITHRLKGKLQLQFR